VASDGGAGQAVGFGPKEDGKKTGEFKPRNMRNTRKGRWRKSSRSCESSTDCGAEIKKKDLKPRNTRNTRKNGDFEQKETEGTEGGLGGNYEV
jgi:hypothetical protein